MALSRNVFYVFEIFDVKKYNYHLEIQVMG